MVIRLSHYLEKVETEYNKARKEWEKLQKEIEREEERYNNIPWINYTLEGKTAERNKHEEIKKAIYKKMEVIRESFLKAFEGIETESDRVFDRKYQYKSGEVDLKGASLLQTGAMSTDEIINIADDYLKSGNYTMYFMCADRLKSDKTGEKLTPAEKRADIYWENAQKMKERTDHDILEAFKTICLSGLRDEGYLSNGVHKYHEEFYQDHKEKAMNIAVITESPWD